MKDSGDFVSGSEDESVGGVDEEAGNGGMDVGDERLFVAGRSLVQRQVRQRRDGETPGKGMEEDVV